MDQVFDALREALKDRYRVDGEIGRGGMATVYAAEDLRHGRRVAIKVLSPDLATSVGADRFEREVRVASRLSHPNILPVFDSGSADKMLYYVMPFVQGESLRDRMTRETHLPIDDAIHIACEISEALGYAHSQGVVHRDVKPENVMLQNGRVLVADFGIARNTDRNETKLTGTGMSIGTAAYMSPEQSAGDAVDARSDIYALGCTLYEMLAGEPVFSAPTPVSVMAKHAFEPVPSIRVLRPAVPVELEAAIDKSLEKVPADRFQTMEEFRRAVLGETPMGTTRETSRYTARYRTAGAGKEKSLPTKKIALAVGGILVLALGGVAVARGRQNRKAERAIDADHVAVLYFDDRSKGQLGYLADGLTESLIERLSGIPQLSVASTNAVRPFRGKDVAADSVASALHVGSIVRGSLEPDGAKVSLTVHFLDASGAEIDRTAIDIDTSKAQVSKDAVETQVTDFLRKRIGTELQLRADRAGTTNGVAWTLVERANKARKDADSLNAAGSKDDALTGLARADSLLAAAEKLDPRWAKIPTRRASVAYRRSTLQSTRREVARPLNDSGLVFADRALALNERDADALEAKGSLLFARYDQRMEDDPKRLEALLDSAEATLRRAVDANPNQAGAWERLSLLYYRMPDIAAANNAARRAYEADAYLASARSILVRLFWTYHDLEQFSDAKKWCNTGRQRFPADPFFTECRMWMYTTPYETPNLDSAWTYRTKYVALTPEARRPYAEKYSYVIYGGALARAGLKDSALKILTLSHATPALDPDLEIKGYEAAMRVMAGDQDGGIALIKEYLTAKPQHRAGFAKRVSWWWRDVQGNPKFKALLAGAK